MDKRSHQNKRKKQPSRTHERSNQGIFDKVASKVKGFLNPWLSLWNSSEEDSRSSSEDEETPQEPEHVPQTTLQSGKRPRLMNDSLPGCSGMLSLHVEPTRETDYGSSLTSRGSKRLRLEHSVSGCSTDVFSQASQEQDYAIHNSESKRQRLNLPDQNPNLLSAGTQTWLDVPERSHIFSQASAHIPSSNVQSPLIENKESSVILNGDDHSENSEGSASTSGCSSLVSHKDRINCMSSIMLSESDIKGRRDAASQKGKIHGDMNLSSNRLSLWSSGGSSAVRSIRSPTVMQTNQPGFSLSAFIGSSKPSDRKVASPFYEGKTTFGGASASRRMPPAATPYQVDRPLRVKCRSNDTKDSYEGMSSAAKRILQTLEKMSSPVTDAKKIPNTNKSPIDLSLYLMPPKHRRNLQSTPAGPSKGPPIADISTISKLTTIKSYGQKRFQNSILDSPTLLSEKTSSILNVLPQILQNSPEMPSLPSGGGKMRNKLHQQHQPAAKNKFTGNGDELSRMSDYVDAIPEPIDLPDIPLPITTLPTIAFGNTVVKNTCDSHPAEKDFVFSKPIELVPNSELSNPTIPVISSRSSPFSTQNDVNKSISVNTFTFSNPIELENPIASPPTSNTQCKLTFNSKSGESSWECSSCWVRNPESVTKCKCCENPREVSTTTPKTFSIAPVSSSSAFKPSPATPKLASNNELQKPISSALPTSTAGFSSTTAKPATSWSCDGCWVSNPVTADKCLACEAPCPSKGKTSGGNSNKESGSTNSSSNSTFGSTKLPVSSSQSGFNFSGLSNVPQVSNTWECDVCLVRNAADKLKCVACETLRPNKNILSGFPMKGNSETKPNSTLSFNASNTGFLFKTTTASSTPTASTPFALSTAATPAADGFVFTSKSETTSAESVAPTSTSPFIFGSGTLSSTKPSSTGSESKVSSTADTPFKFGSQTIATNATASSFGTSSSPFTFGTKPDATNSPKPAASSSENAVPSLSNASQQPVFGNFPLSEKTAASKPNPLFQFGTPTTSNKETSWECSKCHTKNNNDKDKCSSCDAAQGDNVTKTNNIVSSLGTWECSSCHTKNMEDKEKCTSCNSVRQDKSTPDFSFKGAGDSKLKEGIASFTMPSTTSTSSSPFAFGVPSSSTTATAATVTNTAASVSAATAATSMSTTTAAITGFSFGSATATTAPSTGGFVFGSKSEPTATTAASVFKFGSGSVSTSKPSTTSFENNLSSSAAAPFQFGKPSAATTTAPSSSFGTASGGFSFGVKAEPANSIKPAVSSQMPTPAFGTSQSVFGGAVSNAMSPFGKQASSGLNISAPAVSKTNPLFQFGTPPVESSWECSSCHMKNNGEKTTCTSCGTQRQEKSISGFTFKGANDAKSSASALNFPTAPTTSAPTGGFTFNAPATSTTTAAAPAFTFNATPASSNNFVFGTKSEATTTTTSAFTFGSATPSAAKPSITGFENKLPASPVVPFQFGNQSAITTSTPAIGFGSATNNTFAFGNKPETVNSLQPSATSNQMPAPAFGSAPSQPMFGNSTSTPAFGKQAPGGFSFGLPTASNSTPVFQFNAEKKQATQSGFSFGTPAQDTMTPNFAPAPQFNMTPSFNFGAGSASSAGPFQFAASSDNSPTVSSGQQRKIRKAVRRMK